MILLSLMNNDNSINISVAGDFCPLSQTEKIILQENKEDLFSCIANIFKNNDLNIIDLESPLTHSLKGIDKSGPLLKSNPDSIQALNYLGINLVSMSNNHIMDYGCDGLNDTIISCEKAGIHIVGVGKNLSEARHPFFIKIKGKNIAVINVSENEFSSTYGDYSGANPLNLIDNYHDIVNARNTADIVLVLYHGGNEFYNLPSPRVKKTCRFFVEAGADAVVMHHTHVYSGYEIYHNSLIFYGLGNFNYDIEGKVNEPWNYGYTVRLIISDNKIDFEVLPHQQSNGYPGTFLLYDNEKTLFFNRLFELNRIIQDDVELETRFHSFSLQQERLYDMYLQPYSGKLLAPLYFKGILPSLLSKRKKMLLLNLIRCESHRDILLNILKIV